MADNELKELFGKNLKKWLSLRDKTQADLCRYMGISSATASDWCNGNKMPRADKLGSLAMWLGIELDDLLTDKPSSKQTPAYYLDEDARDIAQFLFEHPEYKVLFDGVRKVKKEDLEFIKALLEKFS